MGGICSITEKTQGTVSLPYDTEEEIYQTTKDLYKAVITDLDKYDSTPVVLCPVVGIDLNMANTHPSEEARKKRKRGKRHPKQDILDNAIIRINEYIQLLNTERGHRTPETASVIHRHHGKGEGYKHNYGKLIDGVHPNESTLRYWGKRLDETYSQFL